MNYCMNKKDGFQKKPEQILFSKNTYGPRVKVEHWDYEFQAQPKDHDVYRDGLSNHIGTYVRMGQEQDQMTTETQAMLAQIWTKVEPVYPYKSMVNVTSYPSTDSPSCNKLMELAYLPPDCRVTEYITTNQDDYRNPHPSVFKPLRMASPPWLMNRVIRSDLTQNHGSAPPHGDYQCLDSHTPIHHIRDLRHHRYQSFDPATCLQGFPNKT